MPTHSATYVSGNERIQGTVVINQPDPQVSYAAAIFTPEIGPPMELISHLRFLPPEALLKALQKITGLELGEEVDPKPLLRPEA